MADFCKQCADELFDGQFNSFKNLSTELDDKAKLYTCVLCEDCGFIQVNSKGECVSPDCKKHGGGR